MKPLNLADIVEIKTSGQVLESDHVRRLNVHLDRLLRAVAACENTESASSALDELHRFQGDLGAAYYGYDVALPKRFSSFVKDFERGDIPQIRLEVFQLIRANKFHYFWD